ncbi:hypothetical protein HBB16_01190 [Pseudonocardia sp. MCCB 268]|nr:hypothetical protein [Pseudonocardia cytotoxica]
MNTIAVLSRADEIGVGRPDASPGALDRLRATAATTALRGLCQTVSSPSPGWKQAERPLRTMRQDEFRRALRAGCAAAGRRRGAAARRTGSAAATCPPGLRDPGPAAGVVRAVRGAAGDDADPAGGGHRLTALADDLVRWSGLDELRRVLDIQFSRAPGPAEVPLGVARGDLVLTPRAALRLGPGCAPRWSGSRRGARVRRAPGAGRPACRKIVSFAGGAGLRRAPARRGRRLGARPARSPRGRRLPDVHDLPPTRCALAALRGRAR